MRPLRFFLCLLLASGLATATHADNDDQALPPIFIVTLEDNERQARDDDGGYSTSGTTESPALSPATNLDNSLKLEDVEELDFSGLAVWVFNKTEVDFDPAMSNYFLQNTIAITSHKDINDFVGVLKGYGRQRSNSKGKGSSPVLTYGLFSPSKQGTR